MITPGPDTITIKKPTLVTDTRDNSTVLDYDTTTDIIVPGCSIQPFLLSDKMQQENNSDRDYSRATMRVFAPSTSDVLAIDPHDRFEFAGEIYEIFGQVQSWRRLSGSQHHVQFIIQRRLG